MKFKDTHKVIFTEEALVQEYEERYGKDWKKTAMNRWMFEMELKGRVKNGIKQHVKGILD